MTTNDAVQSAADRGALTPNGGAVMQNVAGKLAEAWTGDAHTADLGFSYPSPGANEVDAYQSSTHSGGWYVSTAQHYADGATSVLRLPGGVPAISYGLDGEGRPTTVADGSPNGLVKSASYGLFGLSAVTFGSNDSDSCQSDASTGRMTKYSFYVGANVNTGTLGWNANGTLGSLALSNNIFPSRPSTTCTYGHDDLGRIASVSCPGVWSQTFTLDAFGNVRKDATTGTSFSADFNLANQISSVGGVAGIYDSDGNLINDPTQNTNSVNSFDAENKPVTLEGTNVLYDAFGRAAEAAEPSGSIEFLYGPGGGKIAVMVGQTLTRADIPLPGGGEAVYEAGGLTAYRHADQLGSAPLASTPSQTVWSAAGYAPYGEAFSSTGSDRRFTGKKSDINGDQYDFLMREYSPLQGRWWTPDPAGLAAADPNNPQSWNRYAYVNGSPLNATDPLGLLVADGGTTTTEVCSPWNFEYSGGEGSLYLLYLGENCHEHTTFDGDAPPDNGGGGQQITTQSPNGAACISGASIDAFLAQQNSPMVGEGNDFLNIGRQYNLDPRLLVSIAGAETSFGKNITAGQYNALNDLYNGMNSPFPSWARAINGAAYSLTNPANGYDLSNTATMYAVYCSTGTTCGQGLSNINAYMRQLGANINALHFPACAEPH